MQRAEDSTAEKEESSRGPCNHANDAAAMKESSSERAEEEMQAPQPPTPPPPLHDFMVGPLSLVLVSLTMLVFVVVSIPIPWFQLRQYAVGPAGENLLSNVFLWRMVTHLGASTTTIHPRDFTCRPVVPRLRALEAFVIISAVFSLILFILAVVYWRTGMGRRGARWVAAVALTALTVGIALNFNIYSWSFAACGPRSSFHSKAYEIVAGSGLFITAWVLSIGAVLLVMYQPTLPADERSVVLAIKVFTFLSLVAFLFTVVACPMPHWKYKDTTANVSVDVLLWRERKSELWTGAGSTSQSIPSLGCSTATRLFTAAQAFSIISIFFTCCSGVLGALTWAGIAGTSSLAVTGAAMATMCTLVLWALQVALFRGRFCGGLIAYYDQQFYLAEGFALSVAAFALMVGATSAIAIAMVLRKTLFPSVPVRRSLRDIIEDFIN